MLYRIPLLLTIIVVTSCNYNTISQNKNPLISTNAIRYVQPATKWMEALPVGNGRLGTMVFGDPNHERIQLNEDSMWAGAPDRENSKGTQEDLVKIRQLLKNGKAHEAYKQIVESFSYKSVKQEENPPEQIVKHVILIGSDGFGAYVFEKAKVPNLRKMMNEGAYTLHARSVLPSSSAVNWASMIMGSGPELHGFTEWGSKTPELPSKVIGKGGIYPTIFSLIDEQLPEAKKGVSYSWGGIGYLFEKNMVDLDYNGKSDEATIKKALEFIIKEKPVLTFIHLSHPDNELHEIGHDTPEYYNAVEKIDEQIGEILKSLKKNNMMEDTVILFSSDHGGTGKGHGGKTLLEVEIPWIIYGKNILPKGELKTSIVTYDTGTTIAYLLGLKTPSFWRGKPITEIIKE